MAPLVGRSRSKKERSTGGFRCSFLSSLRLFIFLCVLSLVSLSSLGFSFLFSSLSGLLVSLPLLWFLSFFSLFFSLFPYFFSFRVLIRLSAFPSTGSRLVAVHLCSWVSPD